MTYCYLNNIKIHTTRLDVIEVFLLVLCKKLGIRVLFLFLLLLSSIMAQLEYL